MTKKNILLTAVGALCVATLYAFTHPETVRENVLTLFYPEKTPSRTTPTPAVVM